MKSTRKIASVGLPTTTTTTTRRSSRRHFLLPLTREGHQHRLGANSISDKNFFYENFFSFGPLAFRGMAMGANVSWDRQHSLDNHNCDPKFRHIPHFSLFSSKVIYHSRELSVGHRSCVGTITGHSNSTANDGYKWLTKWLVQSRFWLFQKMLYFDL